MNVSHPTRQNPLPALVRRYRILLAGLGALFLIIALLLDPHFQLWGGLVIVLFTSCLALFPIELLGSEILLIQALALGGALTLGASTGGLALISGVLLGALLRRPVRQKLRLPLNAAQGLSSLLGEPAPFDVLFTAGRSLLAMLLALLVTGSLYGGAANASGPGLAEIPRMIAAVLVFALLDSGLYWIDYRLRRPGSPVFEPRSDLLRLILIELIPIPFTLMSVIAFPLLGAGSVAGLGSIPLLFSILLAGEGRAARDLGRRVEELSSLNQVSQVLRSTLDLEKLLTVIHTEMTRLLGVDNFYVALYDERADLLWYPLAVKRGLRRRWPTRHTENRLTERVILERKPILLGLHSGQDLFAELPTSEETPIAWIGVPLISSERVIGCLALFSLDARVDFAPGDIDLLTTISGQISVSIENALLYDQAQRRAVQLETLNRTSALISASLDLQEVLAQVCHSAVQVSDGKHSAIYLIDEAEGQVHLARSIALSEDFALHNGVFSLADGERARSLRTGSPGLVADLCSSAAQLPGLSPDLIASLKAEGICAYGSFPLITPEGSTGILAVYYDSPHNFSSEEVDLLQTFAAQVALAVSNARAYARTDLALSQRAQQLSILESVGRELAASTHSDRLFERILLYACDFTASRWGMVGLVDSTARAIRPKSLAGYAQGEALSALPPFPPSIPFDQGLCGRAITSRKPIRCADTRRELDHIDFTAGQARSHLSLPLLFEDRVLGVLTLEKPEPDGYSQTDEAFITQLANQAAIAVANAELYSAVSASRDHLASVINSVQEGILMVDRSGEILLANHPASRFTGLEIDRLEGRRFDQLPDQALDRIGFSPEEAHRWSEMLHSGELPGEPRRTVAAASGVSLERSVLPVRAQTGAGAKKSSGWIVVLRDISAEVEIAQTRELLTETLVHDLRSPLSAVLGALDVIAGAIAETPEPVAQTGEPAAPEGLQSVDAGITGQALQIAGRAARRMMGLVESLLDISRMQAGKMELNLSPVDLPTLVETALADFNTQAYDLGVSLSCETGNVRLPIPADEVKLARVLGNLLDNALKYTPAGGEVRISVSEGQTQVTVTVADSGPGVPEEYREKIFERFTQVPEQHGRRRGSGLGLAFCRLAVQAHGGRIWMEPGPQGGSHFCFTLPRKI